jgi:hypothetical protein
MNKTEIKQLIREVIAESVQLGNEDDVRGTLGVFDNYIDRDSIKIIDDGNKRTYIWFISVPIHDDEVQQALAGKDLLGYLTDKLNKSGDQSQKIQSHVDIVRQQEGYTLVRIVLSVTPVQ